MEVEVARRWGAAARALPRRGGLASPRQRRPRDLATDENKRRRLRKQFPGMLVGGGANAPPALGMALQFLA